MPLSLLAAPIVGAALASSPAAEAPPPAEPAAHASILWAVLQFVPSPELVVDEGKVRFGARWQVTPVLYSFGGNRRLSRWRTFVVEPIARHAGSIELYLAPEVLGGPFADAADRWIVRGGLRSYFPILGRGESLSASGGGSLFYARGKAGAGFDVGLHTFGGFFGLRFGYSPTPGLRMTTIGLEIRVF